MTKYNIGKYNFGIGCEESTKEKITVPHRDVVQESITLKRDTL